MEKMYPTERVLQAVDTLIYLCVFRIVGATQLGQAHFSCFKTRPMAARAELWCVLLLSRYQRAQSAAHASAGAEFAFVCKAGFGQCQRRWHRASGEKMWLCNAGDRSRASARHLKDNCCLFLF